MSREIFLFNDPERFIIGTVGAPGERAFFLQVRGAQGLRTFALEKSQAAALAERCSEILREISASSNALAVDTSQLDTPIEAEFTIGVMSLLWDAESSRLLLEAQSAINPFDESVVTDLLSDDEVGAPPILRVRFTTEMARSFIKRTEDVVASGRQPCMFCGGPIDPSGHVCPRANGYRRR